MGKGRGWGRPAAGASLREAVKTCSDSLPFPPAHARRHTDVSDFPKTVYNQTNRRATSKRMRDKIQGAIERITYYNEDNGYSVVKIMPDKPYPRAQARDRTVTVVGTMPALQEGESAQFTGEWVEDPRYGRQFRAGQVMPIAPQSEKGIVNYLSSGIVRGIGPRTAEKIYQQFGDKTVQILDEEPQRIHEVKGLKTKLADNLIDAWAKNRAMRNVLIYLQGLGVSAKIAQRIYNKYGAKTQQIIQNDPYQLAQDIFLIGFRKADQIASNMGFASEDKARLRAGLLHTLNELTRDGHTFSPRDSLLETACELLGVEDREALSIALLGQIAAGNLIEDQLHLVPGAAPIQAIYLASLPPRRSGRDGAPARHGQQRQPDHERPPRDQLDRPICATLVGAIKSVCPKEQQHAVRAALGSKLSVLTGGPGTGKTTTLQMLIHALDEGRLRLQVGFADRTRRQTPW